MAREKLTPEQTGERAYARHRAWLAAQLTDRELIKWLGFAQQLVIRREQSNKWRSAPFAEATALARLRAVRDEIASRRAVTMTTINDYAGADTAEPFRPNAPRWLDAYTESVTAERYPDISIDVEPNGTVIFRGSAGSCTVVTGPDSESFYVTGRVSNDLRVVLLAGALGMISPIETRKTEQNA